MIRLKLPNFEGPLDLLLYLIRKNELDIKTISLARITGEYLEYITMMQTLDLNIAGEYIVMATTLIRIKVQSLLPHYKTLEMEEQGNEAEMLVKKLKEYEKFKKLAFYLREKEQKAIRCFPRGNATRRELRINGINVLTYDEINNILAEILKNTRIKPTYTLKKMRFDIEQKMEYILAKIQQVKTAYFDELIEGVDTEEIIITFIAVLELVRIQSLNLLQRKRFGRIKVYVKAD